MNHLNSLLIEGCVVDDPRFIKPRQNDSSEKSVCTFTIASYHLIKVNEKNCYREIIRIGVQTVGSLAVSTYEKLRKYCSVRVIGAIRQDRLVRIENGEPTSEEELFPRVYIAAEHIEFRPEKTGKENKNESFGDD